jgi:hypothetical protein
MQHWSQSTQADVATSLQAGARARWAVRHATDLSTLLRSSGDAASLGAWLSREKTPGLAGAAMATDARSALEDAGVTVGSLDVGADSAERGVVTMSVRLEGDGGTHEVAAGIARIEALHPHLVIRELLITRSDDGRTTNTPARLHITAHLTALLVPVASAPPRAAKSESDR